MADRARFVPFCWPGYIVVNSNTPDLADVVDAIITVEEDEIVAAMRLVWERMKIVIEPSAGVPVGGTFATCHHAPSLIKTAGRGGSVGEICRGSGARREACRRDSVRRQRRPGPHPVDAVAQGVISLLEEV